jgi:stearoyl-CoA desaturase (delta-9 desaturase)
VPDTHQRSGLDTEVGAFDQSRERPSQRPLPRLRQIEHVTEAPMPSSARYSPSGVLAYVTVTLLPVILHALVGALILSLSAFEFAMFLFALLCYRQLGITLVSVVYHRMLSHRSFICPAPVSHFLRFSAWFILGTSGRVWAAMHRQHHAHSDSELDPHLGSSASNPRAASTVATTMRSYARIRRELMCNDKTVRDIPDDWIERLDRQNTKFGLPLLNARAISLLGIMYLCYSSVAIPHEAVILSALTYSVTISVGIATVLGVNYFCHRIGYRNYITKDRSTNLFAFDILGMGEALHNNHHARPSNPNLAVANGEIDPGFWIIRALVAVRLARFRSH